MRWADVVLESFSPKAMRKWGYDYPALAAINPGLIMVSTCLFGQSGPLSSMAGYGTMGAALGGLVAPTGWPDRPPCGPFGPYTDFIAPRFTVALILAALDHRRRTGEGQHVDQSQVECSLQFLAPHLLDAQVNGRALDRVANDHPSMAPHGVYPAAGDDEWIAIAARDDGDWRRLCDVVGRPGARERSALRRRSRDGGATAPRSTPRSRPGRGLSPGPKPRPRCSGPACPRTWSSAASPPRPIRSCGAGAISFACPIPCTARSRSSPRARSSSERRRASSAAGPMLGEDTDFVLRELLGYTDAEVDRLRSSGALR